MAFKGNYSSNAQSWFNKMLVIVAKDVILSLVQLIPLTVKGLGAGVGRAEKELSLNVSVADIKKREKKIYFLEK